MYHLRSGVCLLIVICHCDTVKLGLRVITTQYARWIFPRYGTTCLNLRPRKFRPFATQVTSFGDKVEHSALSVLISRIPVLHRGVFHFGSVFHDYFHYCGMELVLIAHRSGATFKIRHVGIIICNNQCSFELTRIAGIDAEITAQFHRRTHPFRDIYERTIAEHRTVKSGKEVITIRHHRPKILLYEVGMFLYCLAYRAEYYAFLGKFLFKSGLHRHRVHYGIDGCPAKCETFFERNAQFVERLHQFRVNVINGFRPFLFRLC